jgi:hypothetical protein
MMRKQVISKKIQSPDGKTIAYAKSVVMTSDDCSTDECTSSNSSENAANYIHQTVTVSVSASSSRSSSYSSSSNSSSSSF